MTDKKLDLSQYRTNELKEKIQGLLSFGQIAIRSLLLPPLFLSCIVFALGIYAVSIDKSMTLAIVFMFLGLILTMFTGLSWGITLFLKRINTEIVAIVDLSLEITNTVIGDMASQGTRPSFKDVFFAVLEQIVLPTVTAIISSSIFFVGGIIAKLIEKYFGLLSQKLVKDMEDGDKEVTEKDFSKIQKQIEGIRSSVDKVSEKTMNTLLLPFRIWSKISFVLTAVVLILLGLLLF
ncbi:MAG: hypothetical protein PQJ58_06730 [Spirochaetales bacterium]|nr:hypothetical protein [Spirochaetales bacterium]